MQLRLLLLVPLGGPQVKHFAAARHSYIAACLPCCSAAFTTDTLAPLLKAGFDGLVSFRYVAWGNAVNASEVRWRPVSGPLLTCVLSCRVENSVGWRHSLFILAAQQPTHPPAPSRSSARPAVCPPARVQGGVRCQHGPAECRLDRVINCATHLNPGQDRWLPFVTCLEAAEGGAEGMEGAVEGCAAKAGLDAAAIRGCAEGRQGDALERAAAEETAALRPPHRWVPWVVVDGIPLGEDLDSLWRYICVAYAGQRPAACYAPPPSLAAARGLQLPAGAGRRGVSLADVAATEPEGAVA